MGLGGADSACNNTIYSLLTNYFEVCELFFRKKPTKEAIVKRHITCAGVVETLSNVIDSRSPSTLAKIASEHMTCEAALPLLNDLPNIT